MYETYEDYSIKHLLALADDFRIKVEAINGSPNIDYERIGLPADSPVAVSAGADGIRYNFAAQAVIEAILGEADDMQTVADEVRLRWARGAGVPEDKEVILLAMEEEVDLCFRNRYSRKNATLGDILALGQP